MGGNVMSFELKILCNFLHEGRPMGTSPQVVYADSNKKALAWIPGGSSGRPWRFNRKAIGMAEYVGVTPGCFLDTKTHQHEQPCWITFLGFDIDAYKAGISIERVQKIVEVYEPLMSLRTSASGKGVHGFIRLAQPVKIEPGVNRTKIIYSMATPIAHRLRDAGLGDAMEKWDYRTFYVLGGRQQWMRVNPEFANLRPSLTELGGMNKGYSSPNSLFTGDPLQPEVVEFILLLKKHGIRVGMGKTQTHIREVYRALKGTQWEFGTKSPMRSDHNDNNGFINIKGDQALIYACADGHPVFVLDTEVAVSRRFGMGEIRFNTVTCPKCGAILADAPARKIAMCACGYKWDKATGAAT